MVRRPGYEPADGDSMAVARLKATLKEASPETRAHILKWLAKFYSDSGAMYSPSVSQERRRITIDGEVFWLLKTPTR